MFDFITDEHRMIQLEARRFAQQEIATIAACPVNTVKTRMFHARAKLKRLLPGLGKDAP